MCRALAYSQAPQAQIGYGFPLLSGESHSSGSGSQIQGARSQNQ